ncbi:MerR family transcriptional regulator [Nocardia huaxiensis]|uniref:MerR family transcriptional regulator n=1 Tax=Nocardia huaxiensis TaxID=2755382 RepID=A0A7D6ZHS8_9NOCA|nr:MerR family transcriptional regulator [Nocardia huaxiensis]QLY31279.1 MerR family transcriptional regulator [Nocardia huaxiensis]
MTAIVPIGEFSRLSLLSVKTLRYYHEIELLEPADVDPGSGYRRYSTDQVEQAHLIRRLRDLNMPLPEIRAVLAAPDRASRDEALRAHLERMEAELLRTRDVVASLRSLLTTTPTGLEVEYRSVPELFAVTITDVVAWDVISEWCDTSFPALYEALEQAGVAPTGPGGATYGNAFYEEREGEVVAFVPLAESDRAAFESAEGLDLIRLPARRFAVAQHRGPFTDMDVTYGALGSHVAEHDTALAEPIRELYLNGPGDADPGEYLTEICWPIV